MRLDELRRTSAFRRTVLLLAFIGLVLSGIFGVVSVRTTDFLVQRVDNWLAYQRDQLSVLSDPALLRFVEWNERHKANHRWEIVLYDRDGQRIAGDDIGRPAAAPVDGEPFRFHATINGRTFAYRGILVPRPNGGSVLISERLSWVALFDRSLLQVALLAGVAAAGIGLAGAAVIGLESLRQIKAMSVTMQAIVTGDLSGRLPRGRRSGDVDRVAAVVNDMLGEIERLMHEVEAVTDAIAHDLRTPLTRLLAALERTERRAQSIEEYADGLCEAIVEVRRLLEIFSAMLRLAELEGGQRRAGFQQVQLKSIAASVVDFLEPLAEEKAIALSLTGADVALQADPQLMFEALGNVVDNAIKYTPSGGAVVVTVVGGDEPGFVVSDTGPGIPQDERTAVLQRFYRVEKSRHIPGNGLGLSMVAAIGALHGMTVTIDDAKPGTRVSLRRTADRKALSGCVSAAGSATSVRWSRKIGQMLLTGRGKSRDLRVSMEACGR